MKGNNGKEIWLVNDPSLPERLNKARREMFSLTGVSIALALLALCIPAVRSWFLWLHILCILTMFFMLRRHGKEIILSPERYVYTPHPTTFYPLVFNSWAIFLENIHLVPRFRQPVVIPAILVTILFAALFIWAIWRRKGNKAEKVMDIILYLFFFGPASYGIVLWFKALMAG